MEKFYFINQSFQCGGEAYTDLCIITGITKADFMEIYRQVDNEWIKECEDGAHEEGFYDRLEYRVKKAGGKLECVDCDAVVVEN